VLRQLEIAGFKSIKSQKIDLGRVTVLIGQNGAGKSNVLEAVGMLSAAAAGTVTYESLAQRGIRLSTPSVYRSALRGGHRPKYFDLAAEFDNLRYHCNIYTNDIEGMPAWAFHSESIHAKNNSKRKKVAGRSAKGVNIGGQSFNKKNLKSTESIVPGLELFGTLSKQEQESLDSLKMFAIYSPATSILRGVDSDARIKSPIGLTGGGLVSAMREIFAAGQIPEFRRFFNILSWYRGISIRNPEANLKHPLFGSGAVLAFSDQFMTQDFNTLYSYDVSEGALYVAFVLALMLHPKSPSFFAIDNIDTALNPGLIRSLIGHMMEVAKARDRQVILTTHNPAALDALDLFDPDCVLHVVDRSETGATVLKRLRPPDGMTKEEWNLNTGGAKLSELWLDGLLGGITPPAAF